jgi:hypothetical protein
LTIACSRSATGELTAERLANTESLNLEDFPQGISGPVYVIGRIPSRAQLDRLIGRWPDLTLPPLHTLPQLRELVARRPELLSVPDG